MQTPSQVPELFILFGMVKERNYEVSSVFLFCKMVRNGIPSFFDIREMARKSIRSIYLLQSGSEQNSEHFPIRGTDGIPTE